MPKKTLALISGLVLITLILFAIALNNSQNTPPPPPPAEPTNQVATPPTTQSTANTVLSLEPQPVVVMAGQEGIVDVKLDTAGDEVTAIQLEIAYDPNFITNVQVTPDELFANPVVLINKNSVQDGRYTYALGIMPNSQPITGIGIAARITFTAANKPGQTSQLALLPNSLVTARGISTSVLKSAVGTLVQINTLDEPQ